MLAHRHRLLAGRRTDDVPQIAHDLVALHSSDPATVYLSALARMANPSTDAVEDALYRERSLLRYHAMRRTIWVAGPQMTAAMDASSTRKIAGAERRQLLRYLAATPGIDNAATTLDNFAADILALVDADGPLTTREIGTRKPDLARKVSVGSGKFTIEVGAHTRVASLLGFEGKLVRGRPSGSWVASEYAWSLTERWTDISLDALEVRPASAIVLRAWLRRFGPGTETDLRWWTGWTAKAVREALVDVEAVQVSLDMGQTGWLLPDDELLSSAAATTDEPWFAVLPSLDPTTMGWKERGWYLLHTAAQRVFDRNGNAGPTIWRSGEVIGGWVQLPSGELASEVYVDLSASEEKQLAVELDRLQAAIGDVRFRVRFPSPNQKELLA